MSDKFNLRIWSYIFGKQLLILQIKQMGFMGEWCLIQ